MLLPDICRPSKQKAKLQNIAIIKTYEWSVNILIIIDS